jgi:AcrR family transcriptional regulator
MPRKRDQDKREAILDAAEEVFGTKGFHPATVDEIAQKAKVAKGTIYLYFQDKLTLFFSTIERRFREVISKLERVRDEIEDPIEAVNRIVDIHIEFAKSNEQLIRQMTPDKFRPPSRKFDHKTHMALVREKIFKPAAQMLEIVRRCIEQGQEKGIFKPDIDPAVSALALILMVRGIVFTRIIMPELGINNGESFKDIKTIFLDGIKR